MDNNNISNFIIISIKPFKSWICGLFLVAFISAIDMSLRPYIIKLILDKIPHITPEQAITELSVPIIFYLSMSLIITIVFRFYGFIWLNLTPNLRCHIADILMSRMMKHSQVLFQNNFTGSIANKIKEIIDAIPDLIQLSIDNFFSHFFAFIIAIFTVWTINYKFAILLSIWLTAFIFGSMYFIKKVKKLSKATAEIRSGIMGYIVDILSNTLNIKLFSSANSESKALHNYNQKYIESYKKRDWGFLAMHSFQGFSFVIYQILCFILLIIGFKNSTVTAGDFILLVSINIAIIDILWSLSKDIILFSECVTHINQGLKIILSPLSVEDKQDAKLLNVKNGEIIFDKVKFHYKDNAPLFQDKSIIIPAKQKIGLVGYSGSGKTTFVNLILRLYDINEGKILIDEQDISECTQDSLRSAIGMISQDPSLFHRSLMENIRYSKPSATDDEVIAAAKHAHAHEFIVGLPHGYYSLVGERGVKLSGGQRQRIAIARAILKDAPILILDEATSQLDSITESYIQESLVELMKNRTTIIIAHRLSTLLHMDRILVFNQGKIVEDGTNDELLEYGGLYSKLWHAQVGGFLPDKS